MTKSAMLALATVLVSAGLGCSTVREQKQTRSISPDGMTAVQTRSQERVAPSGAVVEETEVQTRKVISSPSSSTPDASKPDPAR